MNQCEGLARHSVKSFSLNVVEGRLRAIFGPSSRTSSSVFVRSEAVIFRDHYEPQAAEHAIVEDGWLRAAPGRLSNCWTVLPRMAVRVLPSTIDASQY